MDRVDDRPQEADRHGLDFPFLQGARDPVNSALIEWRHDLARSSDTLRHLEGQRARDIRLWIGDAIIEGGGASTFADQEDIGMACSNEKGGSAGRSAYHRIDRPAR